MPTCPVLLRCSHCHQSCLCVTYGGAGETIDYLYCEYTRENQSKASFFSFIIVIVDASRTAGMLTGKNVRVTDDVRVEQAGYQGCESVVIAPRGQFVQHSIEHADLLVSPACNERCPTYVNVISKKEGYTLVITADDRSSVLKGRHDNADLSPYCITCLCEPQPAVQTQRRR